ncbi:hypothetical protein HAX54_000337 [Datura stramonium]|uniref:F-box protein n=1 Tax=Datura stramonium TaxID=4076 RepID=A0ABS8T1S0_DATST|nr:hypothetical protein [Datura stramonium]
MRKMIDMAGGRLSDLPESVLLYILSAARRKRSRENQRFIYSMEVSLDVCSGVARFQLLCWPRRGQEDEDDVVDFVTSTHRKALLDLFPENQKI